MVDLDILKKKGVSIETLKEKFRLTKTETKQEETQKDVPTAVTQFASEDLTQNEKVGRLVKRIRSRIQQGLNYNLTNYRTYHALDAAWDMPLKQITPTMIRSLLDKTQEPTAVMDTLKSWGIDPSEVIVETMDPKTPGKKIPAVSIPAFSRVFIPLAKAYVTIREAKLVNDRNQTPHFKFEPAISNQTNRMRCEVITAAVEEMSQQYSYFDTEKEAIRRMLHYGEQILFPMESWHYDTQLVGKDSPYKGKKNGEFIEAVVREGVRYHHPHPARTYRDQAHFASTLNTGTGATYAGYWRVMRYSEIVNNKNYWNLDVIKIQRGDWYTPGKGIFENVYPCTLGFPSCRNDAGGVSEYDSEKHVGDGFYSSTLEDSGILINEYFERLNPKENGLGDYDYEVWFRFVLAGDDTVIFAEPLPYTAPCPYYGYDTAEGRTMQSSMALEILPFQDHLTNLFTQYLLSVKQNLFTMTLVDTDVVNQDQVNMMRGWSNLTSIGFNVTEFSGKEFKTRDTSPRAIYSERFPQVDTQSIAQAMSLILQMVERLLVMSPQEMGQPASHEQTREEVKVISAQSSARLEFTGAAADRAREAIKRQLYEGKMAYGEDEFYAQIPADPELLDGDTKAKLEKLGFTWHGQDSDTGRITVKATKTAVQYQSFVANRDGADRINEAELASAMAGAMTQWMSNPILSQAIGPDQAITMVNFIARAAGFPRDFKLVNKMNDQSLLQQNNEQLLQQVQQALEQIQQQIKTEVQGALKVVMDDNGKQEEEIQANTQAVQTMQGQLQVLLQMISPRAPMPMAAPMPMMPEQPAIMPDIPPEMVMAQ